LFWRAIARNDGNVIDLDQLRAPRSPREAAMRRQNDKLKSELRQQRALLEELKREREVLREVADDAATEALRKENARLEQELLQSRQEMERLAEEVRRLRQPLEKRRGKVKDNRPSSR
jgi:chromosome segregation ATPase